MIVLSALTARAAPIAVAPLTASLGPGVHALLGAREDGVSLVLDVIAGRVRPRSGAVRVFGGAPRDADVRRALAYIPLDAALPDALRVDEALAMAAEIRGVGAAIPNASTRLDALGVGALATRRVRSLAKDEARAVALAEAITSGARAILVEEPFAMLDPRAGALLAAQLRARGRDGACVVFATASVRDALELADDILTFDRGALVRHAPITDPLAAISPRGACLRAIASDARALVAALAQETACDAVEAEAGTNAVVVRGADPEALAGAVARAVLRSEVTLDALVADALPLVELRAAIAGDAAGAFRAAYDRARAPSPPPAEPAT